MRNGGALHLIIGGLTGEEGGAPAPGQNFDSGALTVITTAAWSLRVAITCGAFDPNFCTIISCLQIYMHDTIKILANQLGYINC